MHCRPRSGYEASGSFRKIRDLLFQRMQLDLLVQEGNPDHHAKPFSHLLRIREDEDSPVHSRYRQAILHLVNLVRQLYRPNARKLVQVSLTAIQDESTSLEPPLQIGPVASRQDSLNRRYENGVPAPSWPKNLASELGHAKEAFERPRIPESRQNYPRILSTLSGFSFPSSHKPA